MLNRNLHVSNAHAYGLGDFPVKKNNTKDCYIRMKSYAQLLVLLKRYTRLNNIPLEESKVSSLLKQHLVVAWPQYTKGFLCKGLYGPGRMDEIFFYNGLGFFSTMVEVIFPTFSWNLHKVCFHNNLYDVIRGI